MQVEEINNLIKESKVDTNLVSDGYHTFGELYNHRISNYITVCKFYKVLKDLSNEYTHNPVWKTKVHSDGTIWNGWFILGINKERGEQITYHLPDSRWNECQFATTIDKAPEFDGHTSEDVLIRLKQLDLCN